MLVALTAQLGVQAANWYVDNAASGVNNGSSWANAWTSFGAISWSSIQPGDNLYISGGPTGSSKTYTETLTVGASGTSAARIRIGLDASNSSHNGTVVLDNNYIDVSTQSYVTISGNVNGQRGMLLSNYYNTTTATWGNKVFADSSTGITLEVPHVQ